MLDLDILCFSHLRWDFDQWPQHLMTRAARETRVFFVEEPRFDVSAPMLEIERRPEGVTIAVPHIPDGLTADTSLAVQTTLVRELLEREEITHCLAWYYTPWALKFTRRLDPVATVYDCMDELSAFALAPEDLQALEIELLQRTDVVFTGGVSLDASKRTQHPNVHLFPSSVDAARLPTSAQSAGRSGRSGVHLAVCPQRSDALHQSHQDSPAGGVPVVSTSIRDVVRPYSEAGLVRIADTPWALAEAIDARWRDDPRPPIQARADTFLAASDRGTERGARCGLRSRISCLSH